MTAPLVLDEIVGLGHYGDVRDDYRRAVIDHKRSRRVALGEKVTLVFEDRETLRFQVQEMLFVEQIARPDKIQHELDVYNALLPGPGELSATLFIEITELSRIQAELDALVGIDECVYLVLGEEPDADRVRARFDPGQMEDDRISAVHYLRFALSPAQVARLRDPECVVRLASEHPRYRREVVLSPPVRESLAAGLDAPPPPLLPAAPDARDAGGDEVVLESARVRVVRPARPTAEGQLVVEPKQRAGSLLSAEPALLAEIAEGVRQAATRVAARYGGCRVEARVGGADDGLRWTVAAPNEPPA